MKQFVILFFFLFGLGSLQAAEWDFNANCQLAYKETLALRFDAAHVILMREKALQPENVCVDLLENYRDFLEIFISEDKDLFLSREPLRKQRLSRIETIQDDEPFKNISLAVVNLQWAFARLKFGEYFTAAIELRRAYFLMKENSLLFPDFKPNLLGNGIFNVLIGAVPPKYEWGLKLVSMEGSINKGRMQLYQLLEASKKQPSLNIWQNEILFYLSFVELNLVADSESAKQLLLHFDSLETKSNLLIYAHVNMLMKLGMNDQAALLLSQRDRSREVYPFYYLNYLEAETRIRKLSFDAVKQYTIFLENFKGTNYRADAARKIGWLYLIQADTAAYLKQMQYVLNEPAGDVDADKQAIIEAESARIYHPEILKARLLFDGGYYDSARLLMKQISREKLDFHDQLEYTYRLGRIADAQNNIELALNYYSQTIELGAESPYYYAANAALKSAEIYEHAGNPDMAVAYYKQCLELKPDSYRDSIHQKAKAGLNRLKK